MKKFNNLEPRITTFELTAAIATRVVVDGGGGAEIYFHT